VHQHPALVAQGALAGLAVQRVSLHEGSSIQ
jgi:hypothetical protein